LGGVMSMIVFFAYARQGDDVQRIIDTIMKGKLQCSISENPLGNNNSSLNKALMIS
jgi:hypothetical protein